jgi:pimeloyl-ACP methyl ester carboxylesterase
VAERTIEANGVQLCAEPLGDTAHPPILLIMGIGSSMLWWRKTSAGCSQAAGGT